MFRAGEDAQFVYALVFKQQNYCNIKTDKCVEIYQNSYSFKNATL